ncbi:MAG: ABC transporter ATP-binding protein [Alphaproteobacteria bacterium]|nr:ABC transporter ATP-binding protein [Alphaproteobacteria bacterium]
MTTEPLVQLDDVRLTLASRAGPVNILQGVTLRVAGGESLAIVGPSGSGKSTLLATIAGLERPTSGRIRVAGTDLAALSEDALAIFRRRTIGIVFQAFHLVPTMTAEENVALPLEFAGATGALAVAREALDSVGLAARRQHFPGQLSGGEQQRVAIARAFVARPALLLADEPTGNLDHANGLMVADLLFALRRAHGTTLVLISHNEDLAGRCDRTLRLDDGRFVAAEVDVRVFRRKP